MLNESFRNNLINDLIRDEGYRSQPYDDATSIKLVAPKGKVTLGCGRNLDDFPLTLDEAKFLMQYPLDHLEKCFDQFAFYQELCDERKCAILNMAYNLGVDGFLSFKRLIAALIHEDYQLASVEILNSKWANQVGDRAIRLSKIMLIGQ